MTLFACGRSAFASWVDTHKCQVRLVMMPSPIHALQSDVQRMQRHSSLDRSTPPPRRGFTLLELVVVLMIAGVVGSISVGRVHAIMVQQRAIRAATTIQNDIESAFAMAGRNRQPIRISWDASRMQMLVTNRAGTRVFRRTGLGRDAYGL